MKELISARVIREAADRGELVINAGANSIITPEAHSVAQQLGLSILTASQEGRLPAGSQAGASLRDSIRHQVMIRLPQGKFSAADVDRIIDRVLAENGAAGAAPAPAPAAKKQAAQPAGLKTPELITDKHFKYQSLNGIKRIDAASINYQGSSTGRLGAGFSDVISSSDKSPMTVGYMSWEDCFYDWEAAYDEVNVVIEGELHMRAGDSEIICRAGDAVYIPRGSSLQVGTNSRVRFVYVIGAGALKAGG